MVVKRGAAECRRVPMLNEAGILAAEFGKGLPLHPARLEAVRTALKLVPLLTDDVAANEVAVVHRYALELSGLPGAYLFDQIMNVKPEDRRRLERHGDIHPRDTGRCGHIG